MNSWERQKHQLSLKSVWKFALLRRSSSLLPAVSSSEWLFWSFLSRTACLAGPFWEEKSGSQLLQSCPWDFFISTSLDYTQLTVPQGSSCWFVLWVAHTGISSTVSFSPGCSNPVFFFLKQRWSLHCQTTRVLLASHSSWLCHSQRMQALQQSREERRAMETLLQQVAFLPPQRAKENVPLGCNQGQGSSDSTTRWPNK